MYVLKDMGNRWYGNDTTSQRYLGNIPVQAQYIFHLLLNLMCQSNYSVGGFTINLLMVKCSVNI